MFSPSNMLQKKHAPPPKKKNLVHILRAKSQNHSKYGNLMTMTNFSESAYLYCQRPKGGWGKLKIIDKGGEGVKQVLTIADKGGDGQAIAENHR